MPGEATRLKVHPSCCPVSFLGALAPQDFASRFRQLLSEVPPAVASCAKAHAKKESVTAPSAAMASMQDFALGAMERRVTGPYEWVLFEHGLAMLPRCVLATGICALGRRM